MGMLILIFLESFSNKKEKQPSLIDPNSFLFLLPISIVNSKWLVWYQSFVTEYTILDFEARSNDYVCAIYFIKVVAIIS